MKEKDEEIVIILHLLTYIYFLDKIYSYEMYSKLYFISNYCFSIKSNFSSMISHSQIGKLIPSTLLLEMAKEINKATKDESYSPWEQR